MRTTIKLDADIAAAAEELRKRRQLGLSEAINELCRAGLRSRPERRTFRQRSRALGLRLDVSNVAEALEVLAGEDAGR